ncbi:alpha/beta fold hydrolase [Mycolicibacterium brisbanense]|uniref:Alpha/beta hydrolase fold n=1 Tax=Mycolicibacterium brisbanense TaxID=146020 RepID=A0A100VXX3_9MYCO|nr:alpha/beta hydrolase [Mycolicibacterium brisbanense]MCV7157762.1 alpha/beta hydrolase [Mycolicibacterium brisbanense]GAS88004.1 alpha/beta hydrolase fold [Mycolicibacterium brisbanense]
MIAESRATFAGVETRVLSVPGSGTPVVLLHGYADSADTWRPVLTRLECLGHKAVAVDLPGFGRAALRAPGPLLPQFDAFADALLQELGPVVLVGNSLGAATAVRAAAHNSDLVNALVALDDPLNARHWIARLARRRAVPEIVWAWVARMPVPAGALRWVTVRAVPKVLYGPGVTADPEVVAYWSTVVSGSPGIAELGRDAFRYAHEALGTHRDVQVSCPTVVVHGRRDFIIPARASRVLHQQITGSELVILPRSGHCPQLDNPDAVTRIIAELLGRAHGRTESAG